MSREKIVIIGGGLAGLTAANYLVKAGEMPLLIEAQTHLGGRVQTDEQDGFLMDRGFQILLPAYPEAKAILDYDKLDLRYFRRGAEVYLNNKMLPFYDPANGIGGLVKTISNGPTELSDLFKLLKFRSELSNKKVKTIYNQPSLATMKSLEQRGFSQKVIQQFWKPFFQGIFLEDDLRSSIRIFEFIFKMFIDDGAAIPAAGMGAIPTQLAQVLPESRIKCNSKVSAISDHKVVLHSGEEIITDKIILACPSNGLYGPTSPPLKWKGVSNFYFTTDRIERPSSYVMLNANDQRVVNNVVHLSEISDQYAPTSKHLISVSANGHHINAIDEIRADLRTMYGDEVDSWSLLKSYYIREALPEVEVGGAYNPMIDSDVYQCGDHMLEGSINAAMRSGRLAAEALLTGE